MSHIASILVDGQQVNKAALRGYMAAQEIVSATDPVFGAVGDNVADDWAAIQAAHDYAFAAGGGWTYLPTPSVDYKTTKMLQVKAGCQIRGSGAYACNINFTPPSAGAVVNAGSFVVGAMYIIAVAGTTNFTAIGSISNSVGQHFIATGAGSGTGNATFVPGPAVRCGVIPSSALNYGMGLRDLSITLMVDGSAGIHVVGAASGSYRDVYVSGYDVNKGMTGWIIDGSNIACFLNEFSTCRAAHCHIGYLHTTTGSFGCLANTFKNCLAFGDYPTDATSIGHHFKATGVDTILIGGDMENCAKGLWIAGVDKDVSISSFGMRFEANLKDIIFDTTIDTGAASTILGSPTLDAAKVSDNSGNTTNVVQYGVAGNVGLGVKQYGAVNGLTVLPVTAGYVRQNGCGDFTVNLPYTGAITGSVNARVEVGPKTVTLTIPPSQQLGNTSATPISFTGLPEDLYPSTVHTFPVAVIENGGIQAGAGAFVVGTATLVLYLTLAEAAWAANANTKGFKGFSATWRR